MRHKAQFLPAPYQDDVASGRLILRDGSTCTIRRATADDTRKLHRFFKSMSVDSLQHRFFSVTPPVERLVETLCDSSDPSRVLTLLVLRNEQIVASGTYVSQDDHTAEVALAVDDRFQNKGIGTQLLERLATIAVRNGFTRFWAMTHFDNQPMIEVFRHSGFPIHEKAGQGAVEIDFSVQPTQSSVELSELRDRLFTAASIRPFFMPNAVAVVGASRNPSSIGYRLLDELIRAGFKGPIYPVNPNATEIHSLRVYPNVRDIPEPCDMAIIAVPRDSVLAAVDDCAARGVRALVVITAGFSEVDVQGRELQNRVLEKVRGYGMRMVGPNCMGILNSDSTVRLNASFSPVFPPAGTLAMSSQSGAVGLAVLALANERNLGLSTFVSVGNKADVSGNDLIQYWETDDKTRVILLYLESFGNPRRFARIARRVSRSKPIVAVKAGRSVAGGRAAGSHTAALAASDVAVDALFRQTGIIRAETLDEMFNIAATLGSQPLIGGRRIGIVTNAGGPGILCTDACEAGGLIIPELSSKTRETLKQFLPAAASVSNPIDMVASAGVDSYRQTVETVLASGEVDALVIIYIPLDRDDSTKVTDAIREGVIRGRAAGGRSLPVLSCFMAAGGRNLLIRTPEETLPVYTFPEDAARVLARCAQYSEWKSATPGIVPAFDDIETNIAKKVIQRALRSHGDGWLTSSEVGHVLDAFCIPRVPAATATTADDAVAIAERLHYPVAMKLASRTIVHKTEVGGVRLDLANADDVRKAFREIQKRLADSDQLAAMDGVVIQKMIPGGVELMIGVADDPLFGPLVAFGLGGIHVEILRDVCFRITPLTDKDASAMIREIRGYRLLEGYRGHAAADVAALEDILLRISSMVESLPEITDLDLNPIVALPPGQGCCVLDARIRVRTR